MMGQQKRSWQPGYRFQPTDVELVKYYLKRKVLGKEFSSETIAEIDIYKHAPWDLPDMSRLKTGDLKWYFFCPITKKYDNGRSWNRSASFGYWKPTGKDKPVVHENQVVGMIRTLVFHQGKAPKGARTDWVMHEYRLHGKELRDKKSGAVVLAQHAAYVLCVVFKKKGKGPKNGAQYGAPFKEEDWSDGDDDDDDDDQHHLITQRQAAPLLDHIDGNASNANAGGLITWLDHINAAPVDHMNGNGNGNGGGLFTWVDAAAHPHDYGHNNLVEVAGQVYEQQQVEVEVEEDNNYNISSMLDILSQPDHQALMYDVNVGDDRRLIEMTTAIGTNDIKMDVCNSSYGSNFFDDIKRCALDPDEMATMSAYWSEDQDWTFEYISDSDH